MLLARATARGKEVAVRAALGAGRRRLIRQFLTEVLLLCAAGGIAGTLLAAAAVTAMVRLAGTSVPRLDSVALDGRVLAFVVVVSALSGIVFGVSSVLRLSRPDPASTLRDEDRGSSTGRGTRRARGVLMISEVALTCVLLVGAGLMLRSFVVQRRADPGWDAARVVSMIVSVSGTAESPAGRRTAFYQSTIDAIRALPGVEQASAINHLPLAGDIWTLPITVEGAPTPAPGDEPSAAYRVVFPDYFETFGVDMVRGRGFSNQDTLDVPPVVVVNEYLAARTWPGQDPIGRRLEILGSGWATVVGVAKNTFLYEWAGAPSAEAYLPYLQSRRHQEEPAPHTAYMTLVVRAREDPALLVPAVRGVVRSIAPDVTVSDVLLMRAVAGEATAGARFLFALLGGFAAVALTLASVGLYGVISYDVASRLREIGIRLALGASPRQVLSHVVGRAMTLVALGTGVGLAGAYLLSGLLAGVLHDVPASDPLVFGAVPMTLCVVAALACLIPAWRASRVQPLEQLR
jgi:putative ABC transport system permease protein